MLTPPTITFTSALLLKSKPGDATLSPPVTGPMPVAQAMSTWPGLDGEKVKPPDEKVVKRSMSSCAAEM